MAESPRRRNIEPPLEGNEPVSPQHIPRLALHIIKSHKAALLALQVVEESRQRSELHPTSALQIRTMIHLLLVHWRVEMRIQAMHGGKPLVTYVALPAVTVERAAVR